MIPVNFNQPDLGLDKSLDKRVFFCFPSAKGGEDFPEVGFEAGDVTLAVMFRIISCSLFLTININLNDINLPCF